ncbi:MAG: hypothetical protein OXB88_00315 [Bacteriovoracales bacterium]|nr:hypothetical protein [Bacteriovoracales bacterium]
MIVTLAFGLAVWTLPVMGGIRHVSMDASKVEDIYLCPGHLTVLRFREIPQRIVGGREKSFKFGFVGNDITIWPLERTESTLYVYAEYDNYAFNLKDSCHRRDRLVKVGRKSKKRKMRAQTSVICDEIKITSGRPRKAVGFGVWMIDLIVSNRSQKALREGEIVIDIGGPSELVMGKKVIESGESVRGRVIFSKGRQKPLTFTIGIKGRDCQMENN